MMKWWKILAAFGVAVALSPSVSYSQADAFETCRLPGWTPVDSARYIGKELYGYIDGGAEQYYEYGFKRIDVWRWKRDVAELTIERWGMGTPLGAVGVFSVSHPSGAVPVNGLPWSALGTSALLVGRGTDVISASISSGRLTPELRSFLIRWILRDGNAAEFRPPAEFMRKPLRSAMQRFFIVMGPVALRNVLTEWEEWLEGFAGYTVYATRGEWSGRPFLYARVHLADVITADRLTTSILSGGIIERYGVWTGAMRQSSRIAVRREGRSDVLLIEVDGADPLPRRLLQSLQ